MTTLYWSLDKKDSFVNFVEEKTVKEGISAEDAEFVTVAVLDCRGLEPVEWHLNDGFAVVANDSGTQFNQVSLAEGDWYEYDEPGGQSSKCLPFQLKTGCYTSSTYNSSSETKINLL